MKVNESNHGMKGKPKTCGLTITTRSEITSIGFWVSLKTRTNQTRGRHSFFFSLSQLLPLNLPPVYPMSLTSLCPPFLFPSLSPDASLSHSRLHENACIGWFRKETNLNFLLFMFVFIAPFTFFGFDDDKKKGCFPVSRIYILVFHTLHRDTSWCDHCYTSAKEKYNIRC